MKEIDRAKCTLIVTQFKTHSTGPTTLTQCTDGVVGRLKEVISLSIVAQTVAVKLAVSNRLLLADLEVLAKDGSG